MGVWVYRGAQGVAGKPLTRSSGEMPRNTCLHAADGGASRPSQRHRCIRRSPWRVLRSRRCRGWTPHPFLRLSRAQPARLLPGDAAASGDSCIWGTAFRSGGCSVVRRVPAPSPFVSSPACKEN